MRGYRSPSEESSGANFPFIEWGAGAGTGVILTIVLALTLSTSALGFVSFLFGGIGLTVTVAGFAFTIWQLRRTQTATDAATNALDRARREFATLNVLEELQAVRSAAESTREHMLGQRWPAANGGYDRIREKLMRIVSTAGQLSDQEDEDAKNYVAHILGASAEIEGLNAGDVFDSASLRNRLRELENFSLQVEIRTRENFSGSQ